MTESSVKRFRAPRRDNPNIEMPPDDSIPLLPDEEHGPPVETPPPDNQGYEPDPPPVREPDADREGLLVN